MQSSAKAVIETLAQDPKARFALDFNRDLNFAESLHTELKDMSHLLDYGCGIELNLYNKLSEISFTNTAKTTLLQLQCVNDLAIENSVTIL